MSRSQTSTEYLIILAVVIIIALIVVGVLGGIPGIGGGAGESASRAALAAQTIGITGYSITDYDTTITVRNNNKDAARINSMSIGGQKCGFVSNVRLAPGETRQIDCPNVYELEQSRAEYAIVINWTDMKTQTNFTQSDPSLKLKGEVGSEYLGVLDNTPGFSFASKGCWDTSGSEPYPICTCYDLNLTRTGLSNDYELQNNIDFDRCMTYFGDAGWTSGSGWDPIGTCTGWCDGDDDPYLGHFYGDSHHVGGLFIDRSTDYIGLFGSLNDAGTPAGNVSGVGVSGSVTGDYYVGGLVGDANYATIDNSYATSTVSGDRYVGGLVGDGIGLMTSSYATGSISGNRHVGGLLGYALGGTIEDSYATGSVSGTSNTIGGLVGYAQSLTISSSYATGSVSGDVVVGGLAGVVAYGTIDNSYATGSVSGTQEVGGLAGETYSVTIENSYATGSVTCTGTEYCGGLVGQPTSLTLTGTNTWVNHPDDTATGCVGQPGTLTGTSAANCSP